MSLDEPRRWGLVTASAALGVLFWIDWRITTVMLLFLGAIGPPVHQHELNQATATPSPAPCGRRSHGTKNGLSAHGGNTASTAWRNEAGSMAGKRYRSGSI